MSSANILIAKGAYKAVPTALCVLAITGAGARTLIRLRSQQLRILDDVLLLWACICLIAATILLVRGASTLYRIETFKADPAAAAFVSGQDIIDAIAKIQEDTYPFGVLIWLSVFSVKFCYLLFFRQLIDRLSHITSYWKITFAVTAVAYIFNATASFIACPEFGNDNLKCATPYYLHRTMVVEATTIVFDILTDLMILVIPPYLVWKVQISRRQKLGIAFFLCLSTIMVLIAIIRISQIHNESYNVWATFWQQLEGCVAISMISLTAFRTLFVSNPGSEGAKGKGKGKGQGTSGSYRRRLWYRYKETSSERRVGDGGGAQKQQMDVTLPSATLTGMRTFIKGSPRTSVFDGHGGQELGLADGHPRAERDPRHDTILVTQTLDWDSDSASRDQSSVQNLV